MKTIYHLTIVKFWSTSFSTILFFAFFLLACQSQKNIVRSKDGKLSIDKSVVINDLKSIIDTNSELTVDEKKVLLNAIIDHDFQDTQLDSLVALAENALYSGQENQENAVSTEVVDISTEVPRKNIDAILQEKLTSQFGAITKLESNDESEEIIIETLTYFESKESPVLIILREIEGKTFYDRPTTIEKYLYYLKDLKKNRHQIEKLDFDANEKINKMILANR